MKSKLERGSEVRVHHVFACIAETQPGQPRVSLGSTWGQVGVKLGSDLDQHGFNMGSTWGQTGVSLGSTWGQPGASLRSTWGQPGVKMGRAQGQAGVSLGSTCTALLHLHFLAPRGQAAMTGAQSSLLTHAR